MGKVIAISGGHHTSALIVAKKLQEQGHKIIWFGHKHSMRQDTQLSAEYQEIKQADIEFHNLRAPRLFQINLIFYLIKLFLFTIKFIPVWCRYKIQVFIGFGGYLMAPCALAATVTKTPFFIHEQTTIAGRANRWLSVLATKIFVSWPIAYTYPESKTIYTGLPLRYKFLQLINKPQTYPKLINNNLPTILVIGGKQGSHFINQLIAQALPEILPRFNLIHQTGQNDIYKDHLKFNQLAFQLKSKYPGQYLVYPYLNSQTLMSAYRQANLIISRSGAHTCYELSLLQKPAILIPAPFIPGHEQEKNAALMARLSFIQVLSQEKASKSRLVKLIYDLTVRKIKSKENPLNLKLDADEVIFQQLKPWLG